MEQAGHREQKKNETRRAIVTAAQSLFLSDGYARTTLGDIAAAANIAPRTIFSYFPSKEAIIFYDDQLIIDDLLRRIETRADATVFDTVKTFLDDNRTALHKKIANDQLRIHELIESNPALAEHFANMILTLERSLTTSLAHEHGLPVDSMQAQLVAATCRAAIYYQSDDPTDDRFDIVTTFIEAGLKATTKAVGSDTLR